MSRPAAIAIVAATTGVLLAAGCGSDAGDAGIGRPTTTSPAASTLAAESSGTGPAPPSTTLERAALGGAALELAQAIDRAATLTYHAVYERPAGAAAPVVVDLYRRPPLARRDTSFGDRLRAAEYRTGDGGHVACLLDEAGRPSACEELANGGDPGDPVLGVVDPGAGRVVARDDTVAGVEARCFTVTGPTGAAAEACFDDEGIPLVVDGGDGDRLERTSLERQVADEDVAAPPVGDTP